MSKIQYMHVLWGLVGFLGDQKKMCKKSRGHENAQELEGGGDFVQDVSKGPFIIYLPP